MADRLDNRQSHSLVGQEPERPPGMPGGWRTTPESNASCLPLTIQAGLPGGMVLFLPGEGGLQPLFDQPLSDSHNGIDTDGEALGYPRIGPCRTIRIGFQQDIGMPDLVGRSFPRADQLGQVLTFCIGKTHDVFFGYYTLRLIPCSSLKRNDTLVTHKNKDDKALVL